jgi:carbonic anhydrase
MNSHRSKRRKTVPPKTMPQSLQRLIDNNRKWAQLETERDPAYFERLLQQQNPEYLWIGCSDSRVPANQITGLAPGEVFVHRNVGNVVVHTDLNCLTVIDFAVDLLRVKHIIVVGHYGCSGVKRALQRSDGGLADNWLRHIQDVHKKHQAPVDAASDGETQLAVLCELNVIEQAVNVCRTSIVQDAWRKGFPLSVHGWIYSLSNGLLVDLGFSSTRDEEIFSSCAAAVRQVGERYGLRAGIAPHER